MDIVNYNVDAKVCSCCLSADRRLRPLLQYETIFLKLMEMGTRDTSRYILCWECIAMLRKIIMFKKQVRKAQILLEDNAGKMPLPSLSKLGVKIVKPETSVVEEKTSVIEKNKDMLSLEDKVAVKIEHSIVKVEIMPINEEENIEVGSDGQDGDFDYSNDDSLPVKSISVPDIEKSEIVQSAGGPNRKHNTSNLKKIYIPKCEIINVNKVEQFKSVSVDFDNHQVYREIDKNSEWFTKPKYKCENCIMIFKDRTIYRRHNSSSHRKDYNYICTICSCTFYGEEKLSVHMENHKAVYECLLCPFKTSSRMQVQEHVKDNHSKVYRCKKCDNLFSNRTEFYQHYKEIHKKFMCNDCGKVQSSRRCIIKHIQRYHTSLHCKLCDKTYKAYRKYFLHMYTCHRPPKKVYCVECDHYYRNLTTYKEHIKYNKKHEGRRRIKCLECDNTYSKRMVMMNHYRLVHLKKSNHYCQSCDQYFLTSGKLNNHRRTKHEGWVPPKDKICSICGRGFSSNRVLTHHVRTHTGERPNECELCPARFTQKYSLKIHLRNVHGAEMTPEAPKALADDQNT